MSQSLLDCESLLNCFNIAADDLPVTIDRVVDRFYEWLPQQPEFKCSLAVRMREAQAMLQSVSDCVATA
jgi:hypothetical protein